MAWEAIKATQYQRVPGGITIWDYLLKNHGYSVPPARSENPKGITIVPVPVHLLEECNPKTEHGWVVTSSDDLATKNIEELDPNGLMPHFIVTRHSVWQLLDTRDCWRRSNGSVNDSTICIGITMDDGLLSLQYKTVAVNHAAMLTAYLLHKFRLSDKDIGITKNCPVFFTSRWKEFRQKVRKQMKKL